ncbi:MAG: hypothetical protein JWQ40_270 [Segetibacter sp.]|nr:hypothetical protein [Segetibacter sp.]
MFFEYRHSLLANFVTLVNIVVSLTCTVIFHAAIPKQSKKDYFRNYSGTKSLGSNSLKNCFARSAGSNLYLMIFKKRNCKVISRTQLVYIFPNSNITRALHN